MAKQKKEATNAFQYTKAAHDCAPNFSGSVQLVLRELAYRANNATGECYPGYANLQHYTSIRNKSTIAKALSVLEEARILFRIRRFATTNRYWLDLARMQEMAKPFERSKDWKDPLEAAKRKMGIVPDESDTDGWGEKGFSVEELEELEREEETRCRN